MSSDSIENEDERIQWIRKLAKIELEDINKIIEEKKKKTGYGLFNYIIPTMKKYPKKMESKYYFIIDSKNKKFSAGLEIYSKNIETSNNDNDLYLIYRYKDSSEELINLSQYSLEKMIFDLMKKEEELIFCPITGTFYEPNCPKRERIICKVNIWGCEECSVCMEKTITKTPCGHTLCLNCWSSLNKLVCPLCRESIKYFDKYEEEYEEE